MDYKYKSVKQCKTCIWLRHRGGIKAAQVNELKRFSPQGYLTAKDFHKKYAVPADYLSFLNHLNRHILKMEKKITKTIVNEKEPIKKIMGDVVIATPGKHEDTLDTFIDQFDEALRKKELRMTVKDGLQAIKIKADIESKNKDRKKDILKVMMGANE